MEGTKEEPVIEEPREATNAAAVKYVSFWETFPDAVVVAIFRELKTKRGDKKSSDMLWYIHCMLDPENTFMQALPPAERKMELQKFYNITGKELSSELFKKSVEWYKKYWISAPRRVLNSLRNKLFESEILIEKKELATADDILYFAEMQKAFKMFKDAHDEALASFKSEGPIKRKLGGEALSAADDGSIFDLL